MRTLLCALALLGMAGLVQADVDWEGDNNGLGDGWDFNNALNWDDHVNPAGDNWNIHRRDYGYYVPFKAWDIHVTSDIATVGATMYDRADYPVTVTVNENVNLTMTGELVLQRAQNVVLKTGASLIMGPSFDLADQQINLGSTGGAYMRVESGGRAAAGVLRHDNGSVLDLYGTFRAGQISRIDAWGSYAFSVYGGGLIWVEDMAPSATAWDKGGKITQYLCSTVQLRDDRTGFFENYVQKGETGEWAVDYGVTRSGYTTIRLQPADACDFNVSPVSVTSLPGADKLATQAHELTVLNPAEAGGVSLSYTVVEVNRDGVETDVPWLSADKYSGGPIAPSGTDIVTATVDYTKLDVGVNLARLRFIADCNPCFGFEVEFIAPFILGYNGDVDPETPDAGGPGMRFTERANDSSDADDYRNADGLVVEPNALALDGYELKITDDHTRKLKLRTAPSQNIGGSTGATIVGRLRTTFKFGSAMHGENLMIWHDGGGSVGCHWSGAGDTIYNYENGIAGYLTARDNSHTFADRTLDWYVDYHVIRVSMGQVSGSRAIRVYFDENPTPVIEILNAPSEVKSTDSIGFGTGSTVGQQIIYFDWITGTNAGMFAPGEEEACIGRSLYLGGCYDPCNEVFADADGDGDVDQADFAVFQICYTGDGGGVLTNPEYCQCFDRRKNDNTPGQDNDVDSFDLAAFEDCASGPGVPADPACND